MAARSDAKSKPRLYRFAGAFASARATFQDGGSIGPVGAHRQGIFVNDAMDHLREPLGVKGVPAGQHFIHERMPDRADRRRATLIVLVRPFLIALQFLTRLPVRTSTPPEPHEIGRSLLTYPLVGLHIGLCLALLAEGLAAAPSLLCAALLLCAWVLV